MTKSISACDMEEEYFDCFLCHNSDDKQTVRSIYNEIKKEKLSPWMDESDMRPGLWRPQLSKIIRTIRVFIVFLGPHGLGPTQEMEIEAILKRHYINKSENKCIIVPVYLDGYQKEEEHLDVYEELDAFQGIFLSLGEETLKKLISYIHHYPRQKSQLEQDQEALLNAEMNPLVNCPPFGDSKIKFAPILNDADKDSVDELINTLKDAGTSNSKIKPLIDLTLHAEEFKFLIQDSKEIREKILRSILETGQCEVF
jgi:hypothetical protein